MWSAIGIALSLLSKIIDLLPKKASPNTNELQAKALENEADALDAPKPRTN